MDDTEVGTTVAHAIAEGLAMSDDGNAYSSAQDAIDAAQNWVWLPPNTTFNENLVIDQSDFMLKGSGYTTVIDGGTSGRAIESNGNNNSIKNLRAETDSNNGNNDAITTFGYSTTVADCNIPNANRRGVEVNGTDSIVTRCYFGSGIANNACVLQAVRGRIVNCIADGCEYGISTNVDDSIIAHNIILNVNQDGITDGNDAIIIGNRVHNSGNYGIAIFDNDVICANNRVSNSGNTDIQNSGSGTVLDSNLTGGAN